MDRPKENVDCVGQLAKAKGKASELGVGESGETLGGRGIRQPKPQAPGVMGGGRVSWKKVTFPARII